MTVRKIFVPPTPGVPGGSRSETSGVGTSLDVTASQGTFDQGRQQSVDMDEIVPIHVERRAAPRPYPTSDEQVHEEQPKPEFTERVITLKEERQFLLEDEPYQQIVPESHEG